MNYYLGWLPDPPDDRDLLATSTGGPANATQPMPAAASCVQQLGDVLDQGHLGSCVAQATAKVLYASLVRQHLTQQNAEAPELPSRLAIYYLARASHQMQHFDSGTFLRAAFQILNRFGFCPEDVWPYHVARFSEMPPTRAFRLSFDQRKPTVYWRIFETGNDRLDAVRRSIAAGYPVAFGTRVSHDFVRGGVAGKVWDAPAISDAAGGHAMVFSDYASDGSFGVLNSWGTGWSDDGWCRFSESYVTAEVTRDLWVAEHAPVYSTDLP